MYQRESLMLLFSAGIYASIPPPVHSSKKVTKLKPMKRKPYQKEGYVFPEVLKVKTADKVKLFLLVFFQLQVVVFLVLAICSDHFQLIVQVFAVVVSSSQVSMQRSYCYIQLVNFIMDLLRFTANIYKKGEVTSIDNKARI